MANAIPTIPMTNLSGLYLSGMNLSTAAAGGTTLVSVTAGLARDGSNVNDIVIPAAIGVDALNLYTTPANVYSYSTPVVATYVAQVDLSKSGVTQALTGAVGSQTLTVTGGLDVGTIAASTMYAIYAIGSSVNALGNGQPFSSFPGAVIASTSFSGPVLPSGYDMWRRVGAVRTDSSSKVEAFNQVGSGLARSVYYTVDSPQVSGTSTTNAFTAVSLSAMVPPVVVSVFFNTLITAGAAGNSISVRRHGSTGSVSESEFTAQATGTAMAGNLVSSCNSSASVDYFLSTGASANLYVIGYQDQL